MRRAVKGSKNQVGAPFEKKKSCGPSLVKYEIRRVRFVSMIPVNGSRGNIHVTHYLIIYNDIAYRNQNSDQSRERRAR
jgi:hypothetical protein